MKLLFILLFSIIFLAVIFVIAKSFCVLKNWRKSLQIESECNWRNGEEYIHIKIIEKMTNYYYVCLIVQSNHKYYLHKLTLSKNDLYPL